MSITAPIAPYNNFPINSGYYIPSVFDISDIDLGLQTTITTTLNSNYVIGQLCRLLIPYGFGSVELNQITGYVIDIPNPNQVVLDINSTNATPFVDASYTTRPQIVAVGDVNTGYINSNGRVNIVTNIPGSFINISPL